TRDGSCRWNNPRIGRQHAVDILENLDLRAEGRRERDRANVAAAAAKCRYVADRGAALEAGHDRNLAVSYGAQHAYRLDRNHVRVAEVIIGDDAGLATSKRDGRISRG